MADTCTVPLEQGVKMDASVTGENSLFWSLNLQPDGQTNANGFIDILAIKDKCNLSQFLNRGIRIQSPIGTRGQNWPVSSQKTCHIWLK